MTFIAALVVFAVVQDRVTAAGAREYVARQRAALSGRGAPVTIEEVMGPAVRRSVLTAAGWAGLVVVLGSLFLVPRSKFTVRGSGERRE